MATANQMTNDTEGETHTQTAVVLIEAAALILAAIALMQGYNLFAIAMLLVSIRAGLAG